MLLDRVSSNLMLGVAAKGLLLVSACLTATLGLVSPDSLTARVGEGVLFDGVAITMLLLSLVGWLDIAYTDIGGRTIWPSLPQRKRHPLCVGLFTSLSGLYLVLAFAATDYKVETSWVLVSGYMGHALFGAVLALSVALEDRGQG